MYSQEASDYIKAREYYTQSFMRNSSIYILINMLTSSINRLINVDLPVLTGPTTPMYISPFVLALISLYT